MRIPYISSWPKRGGVHATFKLSLSAIRPEALLTTPQQTVRLEDLWAEAHQRNVRLMNLISRWPQHSISCELHVVSSPSLDRKVPSHTEIALLCHIQSDDGPSAIELALADSIEIDALLTSFWPSAEWSFVGKDHFWEGLPPFKPQSCLCVGRRTESISPARPFSVERLPIGFQTVCGSHGQVATRTTLQHLYPWVPSAGEDLSAVLESLLLLPSPRWIVLRIGNDLNGEARAHALEHLANAVDTCERFLAGTEPDQIILSEQAKAIRDASLNRYAQLTDGVLRCAVLIFAPGQPDYVTANVLGQCVTGDHSRRQIANILEGGFSVCAVDPQSAVDAFRFFEEEPFSAEETAGAFRLPFLLGQRDFGLRARRYRTVEIQSRSALDTTLHTQLGVNVHNGIARPIGVEIDDRMHHSLFIGATGVGKSTMLLSSMLQDAQAGRGLALVDPPGDLADEFLARFPKERSEDLIIVDFEDREFPVPLNLLAWGSADERDLIIDTLYETLLSVYKSPEYFGPVFEQYFRSGLRLLLGDQPRKTFTPTLLELPQVFRNHSFRKYLESDLEDDDVKDAIEEASRVSGGDLKLENVAPYVTSKLNRFLQDTQLRRIVGHGDMALDFRAIMDSGKIVIFKLAQGRLGAHTAGILTAQLVARFRLAAMSRADIPCGERKPFLLYCDEAHAVCDENVADMLSQCRKYSLGLVLATQYAKQLQDKGVLQAVLGNVGTLAVFRVSGEDARLLEPVFSPAIGAQDLVECPNWKGYMRIQSGQTLSRPFSFCTVRPGALRDPEFARELRERNRRKWGVSAKGIDEAIQTRRKVIKDLSRKPVLTLTRSLEESMPNGPTVPAG